jgi:molybdenum cofactor biosynthesis protein MoaC
MINISNKTTTLRKAIASATVRVSREETIQAIKDKKVPKGDVFEVARTAGLFAAKRTSDMIPDCHPLPIEFTSIQYSVTGLEINILAEIHTIYKTGVEVEAMHTASVVALTMYDMLKPIDKNISIEHIVLVKKSGGKSDFTNDSLTGLRTAVVVCSDSVSKGKKDDRSGKAILEKLKSRNILAEEYLIIPDEIIEIQEKAKKFNENKFDLVIFTGGTGLSPRDVTTEALEAILDKKIPGIEEAMRAYGQQRTPYSMLSRSVSGMLGNTLVLALPGSERGAEESMDAIFPFILHLFKVMKGTKHDS